MIVIENLNQVANQIETERGVSKELLFSAIEQALISACRKKFHNENIQIEASINNISGEARIYHLKDVVENVEDEDLEISLAEAKKVDSKAKIGETIKFELDIPDLGRIAAQTAKQVIIQRIREAEKDSVYEEFIKRKDQIITGTIQRIENRNYLINLGRTEAILAYREQIPGEIFDVKDKVKLFVADIEKGPRGNKILVSRAHPGLLKCLFEIEIPEIQDGIIEIKSVARDAGKRSKVAVKSNNPTVGAVGTCVGQMGGRIQSIIKELGNEKIDVLEWDENPTTFIANALKPAKISQVILTNEEEKTATVVVPNDQLSLAIGKQGINVRLSVKLTGWNLDIVSEEEYNSGDGNKDTLSLVEKMQLEKEKIKNEAASEEENKDIDETDPTDTETDPDTAEEQEEYVKVSELAKELKLKTAELIEKAGEFGVEIKSNRSLITTEQVKSIRENLST